MDRTFLATVGAAVLLLVAGVGAGVYLGGTGVFDRQPRLDPALTQFSAGNATCTSSSTANTSVTRSTDEAGTSYLLVRRNVSVPDRSYTLNATFRRVELANYTLDLRSVETDGAAESCAAGETARVPFTATVQVPHRLNETYGVTIVHDGDRVATILNRPGRIEVRDVNRSG
jgi:hypothetical protein